MGMYVVKFNKDRKENTEKIAGGGFGPQPSSRKREIHLSFWMSVCLSLFVNFLHFWLLARRGRPTRRWEKDINDWMDMTTTQAGRLAEDRILFRQKVQEATSRQEIS